MSTGSWLKTRKKQIVTHTLIAGGFLFFLLFLSEPLFDRFERVAGEAQLYETSMPDPTYNIHCGIDQLQVTTYILDIAGWAFIEGHGSVDSEIYVVLKSIHRTYIFTTETMIRDDVTQSFQEVSLNLDYSGFRSLIPVRKLANGGYTVGVYIKKGNIEALQYTDKLVVRSRSNVKLTVLATSEVQEIPLPPESGGIIFGVDICETVKDENEEELMQIVGWAFIAGQSAENSTIYLVLESQMATYIFDTILQERPDVTAAFVEPGLNLDDSGFIAGIPMDTVKTGTYKLGIYIEKGDIEALQYTSKIVEL